MSINLNGIPLLRNPTFIFSCLAFVAAATLSFWWTSPNDARIATAEANYRDGEQAKTIADRKKAFNTSLNSFLELENAYHPTHGNGRLYFDIANTYYQLEQYPWAILYYMKAEKLMPREGVIERNLDLARKKLSITPNPSKNVIQDFFLHPFLSLPEMLQIFFLLAFITFALASAWIWTKKRWWWSATLITLTLLCVLLIQLVAIRYFAPVNAVMVHATELRRDAGVAFAKVGDTPVPAGTVVEIVGASRDFTWIKVSLPDGTFGYTPQDTLRPI